MSPLLAFGDGTAAGMSQFVSDLTNGTTGVTAQALWNQITPAVPLIVMLVIFAFGYRFITKLIRRGSKGKA